MQIDCCISFFSMTYPHGTKCTGNGCLADCPRIAVTHASHIGLPAPIDIRWYPRSATHRTIFCSACLIPLYDAIRTVPGFMAARTAAGKYARRPLIADTSKTSFVKGFNTCADEMVNDQGFGTDCYEPSAPRPRFWLWDEPRRQYIA